jgi:uncharacterized protein YndB with AHSA1/START domain
MARIEQSMVIDRPIEGVFAFFADMTRLPDWAPEDFIDVTSEGSGSIGAGFRFVFETIGAHVKSSFGWDVYEPPRRLAWSGTKLNVGPGWVEGHGDYAFEPHSHGTV